MQFSRYLDWTFIEFLYWGLKDFSVGEICTRRLGSDSLVDTIHMFSYGFNVLSSLSSLCKLSIYLCMVTSSEELLTFSSMWGITVLPKSEVRLRQSDTCQKSSTARLRQVVSYLTHILRTEKKTQPHHSLAQSSLAASCRWYWISALFQIKITQIQDCGWDPY